MPSVNIFIGGTGVKSGVMLRGRARFYGYDQMMGRIIALDTEPHQEGAARPTLGRDLIVAGPEFAAHMQAAAEAEARAPWVDMWRDAPRTNGSVSHRENFGFTVIRAGAETVNDYLKAQSGLYTLRTAGWLALKDIVASNPTFIQLIVQAIQTAATQAKDQPTILRVVASVAGGTGSGLFLPLITAVRDAMQAVHQVTKLEIHLVLVMPSAFTNTWAGSPDREALRTRGHSGAYAAFREVQSITRGSQDDKYRPEDRPLMGYDARPAIDRVYWLGRRDIDADSTEEDTFFEASRILALCNDDSFEELVRTQMGNQPYTQTPSILTIEYPKYELAQRLAADATVELIAEMLGTRGDTSQSLLALRPEQRNPLVSFIYEKHEPPLLLSTRAGAEREFVAQDEVSGPNGLLHKLHLPNTVREVQRGNELHRPSYSATTDSDWRIYVGRLRAAMEAKKRDDLQATEEKLDELRRDSANFVVRAAAQAYPESINPTTSIVSLGAARERFDGLVGTFDLAHAFFKRGATGAVSPGKNRNRRLRTSQEQEAIALDVESRLVKNLKPEPPKGWYFSRAISGVLFLIAVLSLAALVWQAIFPSNFTVVSTAITGSWTPQQQQLLIGVILGVVLGAAHLWWRSNNARSLADVRRDAEAATLREWEWYTTCRQAELLFETATAICADVAGDPAQRKNVRAAEGRLGQAFRLHDLQVEWLTELQTVGRSRGKRADRTPPQVFRRLNQGEGIDVRDLRSFWPPVRAEAIVDEHGLNMLAQLDLRLSPPDNVGALNARDYRSPTNPDRNRREINSRIEDLGVGFLSAIEQRIQEKIVDKNFLPRTLDGVMALDERLNDVRPLAESLNDLAREAQRRHASATLTERRQEARRFFVVPDEAVAKRVDDALRFAKSEDAHHAYEHLDLVARDNGEGKFCQVHKNIGQAIALVEFRSFVWPGQDGPKLDDMNEAAKVHYAVGAPMRGGNPRVHGNYNASNTEFYVLPELSAASRIEVAAGRTEPLSSELVPRLYGSHLDVSDVPTVLEMFYIADNLGLFGMHRVDHGESMDPDLWTNGGPVGDQDEIQTPDSWALGTVGFLDSISTSSIDAPIAKWYLLPQPRKGGADTSIFASTGFPLVQHSMDVGRNDPFGNARPRMILFDAFVVAMGYRGGALDPRHLPRFLTLNAGMLSGSWSQQAMYARLRATRERLLKHYWNLMNSDPRPLYRDMWQKVHADAESMPTRLGDDWNSICEVVLGAGLKRLENARAAGRVPQVR